MPDRYWVGGTGNWTSTNTANWSDTSGGAGGASVPTKNDNAYFDGNSDAGTAFVVTVTGPIEGICKDLIIGDGTTVSVLDQQMTMAGPNQLSIYGSLYLPATNFVNTKTSSYYFLASTGTYDITTNGVSFNSGGPSVSALVIGNVGLNATYNLQSAITITQGILAFISGTFNTNNYNITSTRFLFGDANLPKTFNAGTSTITLSFSNPLSGWTVPDGWPITLDVDETIFVLTAANCQFKGGGASYKNLSFTNIGLGVINLLDSNTFENLSFSNKAAINPTIVNIGGDQTVTDTLTLGNSNNTTGRNIFVSNVIGAQRTITATTVAAVSDLDFRDINLVFAAAPLTGSRLGDCGGNSGITFSAPKTVYRRGTGNWSATQWSASSGGATAVDQFPLAQDTAIFDANTTTGTHTVERAWNIGNLDMSASTVVTLATGTQVPAIYGDVTLSNNVTLTGTGILTFAGQGTTQNITSAGKTFTQPIVVNCPSGTFKLIDALTISNSLTFTNGTMQLKEGVTSTVNSFSTSGTNIKYLQSALAGSAATLSQASGTVNVQNVQIKDITATGGARWNAVNGAFNYGNNNGWYFAHQQGSFLPAFPGR